MAQKWGQTRKMTPNPTFLIRAVGHFLFSANFLGLTKGCFQKGGLADVPPEREPERGFIRMFPRNEKRNEGTFACSPGTKTGARARSPKPSFYETALLSPSENFFPIFGFRPVLHCMPGGLIRNDRVSTT